ncbi:hypothetical protein [Nocardioides halotolerans]|uniref:hypothetical protein n=1 Tax=Nocardioides halotolerans TaxID=433660 RepID=UPI00048EEA39|nr:hypothetical protein [Nocardioides halotolerans]
MLTYLLLSGPGVAGRDAAALDARVRAAAPKVLLQVAEAALWADDAGGCLLWTWESATEKVGGRHVHATERGVLALAGSAWSRTSWETAASLAQTGDVSADPAKMRDALTGSFSAVSISTGGRGFVTTDATGTGHVHLARGGDVWAVSNRAPLAAIGLYGDWEPDVEAQAWMAMHAFFDATSTSVRGVELLPASSAVRVAPGTVPVLDVGTTPWEVGAFSSIGVEEALDDAAHALVEQAGTIASTTVATPVVSLSGGKDSRLVLAALRAAGCAGDIKFRTVGMPGASDRETAVLLADAYGLDLEIQEPGVDTGPTLLELDQRVRRHAFQTAGMFGAWNLQGFYGNSTEINATGLYGELMRTIYRFDQPLDTPDRAIDHLQNGMGWDRQRMLRPHVREALDEKLASWARFRMSQGWTPRSLLDLFYAEMRVRRWLGTAEETNTLNATANLLQLKECIIAGFAAEPDARSRDELHYRLIERLDPSLLTVPLAHVHWDSSLAAPDGPGNPTPVHSTVEGSEAWQIRGWSSHRRLTGPSYWRATTRCTRFSTRPASDE